MIHVVLFRPPVKIGLNIFATAWPFKPQHLEDDPLSSPRGLKPLDPLPYVYSRQVFKLFSGLSFKCRGLKAPRPSCLKYLKKLFSRFFFFSQSSALEMLFLSVVPPESSSDTYTLKGLFSLFFL